MNLNGNKSRLLGLTKEISFRWGDTKDHWHDARSAEFERRFLLELPPRVNAAAAALDKLDELFKRIQKDCE
jgi:hypothetical protein